MAAKSTLLSTALQLVYDSGKKDSKGNVVKATQKYSKVKVTAPVQDIYDVAKGIEVVTNPLIEVVKVDNSDITNA